MPILDLLYAQDLTKNILLQIKTKIINLSFNLKLEFQESLCISLNRISQCVTVLFQSKEKMA